MTIFIVIILTLVMLPLVPLVYDRIKQDPDKVNKRLHQIQDLPVENPKRSEVKEEETPEEDQEAGEHLNGLLESLSRVKPLQVVFKPKTELDKEKLRLMLAQAGWRASWATEAYTALRFLGAAIGFLLGSGAHLGFYGMDSNNLVAGLVGAMIGSMIPAFYVCNRRQRRQKEIFHSLPDFLDLVVIAIEVGQGPDMAMREAGQELDSLCPALCSEMKLYFKQLDLGRSRRDALHDLGLRVGLSEMSYMVNTLIQANRFGSSIAVALGDLSERMRTRLQQLAQERAQKVAFKLMFPMVLFIFPGVFVALVGPAAIMIMRDILSMR